MINNYQIFIAFYAFAVLWVLVLENRKSCVFVNIKPIPVLLCCILLTSILLNIEAHIALYKYAVPLALFFGGVGDYLIARLDDFRYGMILFFAGHCIYILFFMGITGSNFNPGAFLALLPSAIYLPLLIRKLRKGYKNLSLLVTAYAVTLGIMVCTAVNVSIIIGDIRFAAGGLFFMLSDILLSQEMLLKRRGQASLLVLPLYYNAQLLLTLAAAGTV
ncbi:MAG: lysoplasmalogenase [Spirochaetes bacterium]|nr:lysoplasmalogenase [Spirochaetota bacterium]MBN2770852.1 lysoplasmalogenase [Spirochaetota bacterium]